MPDASPFELQSLGHFVEATSPTLIALEIPHENPNYIYIPLALASSSKALFHALIASGSAHALNWGLEVETREIKRSERRTLELLEKDIIEFTSWLKKGIVNESLMRERVNSLLATLQTLILYATTAGDTKLWRRHLQGASYILTEIEKYEQIHGPLVLNTFLLETIKFLDVQTALSLNCGLTINYKGIETGWSPNHTVINSSITGMNGFSGEYLQILGRICNLSAELNPGLSSPSPSPPSTSPSNFSTSPSNSTPSNSNSNSNSRSNRSLPELKLIIDEIFQSLEDCRSKLKSLEEDKLFRLELLKRLSLGNHSSITLNGHFYFADVLYHASHVYLARTLTSSSVLPIESMKFVYNGLDAISMVPWDGSSGNLLGWSLIVIGSEIIKDEPARGIIRLRLKALENLGHLNLNQTSILMEEVWKRKDFLILNNNNNNGKGKEVEKGGKEEIITWQGVMKSMGWDLLVV